MASAASEVIRPRSRVVPTSWCRVQALSTEDRAAFWLLRKANLYISEVEDGQLYLERERFINAIDHFSHASVGRDTGGRIVYFSLFRVTPFADGDPCQHRVVMGPHYKLYGFRPRAPYVGLCRELFVPMARHGLTSRLILVSDVSLLGYARIMRSLGAFASIWIEGEPKVPPSIARAMAPLTEVAADQPVIWDAERRVLRYSVRIRTEAEDVVRSGLSTHDLTRYLRRISAPLGEGATDTVLVAAEMRFGNAVQFVRAALMEKLLGPGAGVQRCSLTDIPTP